ncbi:endochitinase-like [Amblyomma americanum]
MYEAGGNIDALNKNLVDVLNLILVPAPHMSSKLVPTVSTVGKKYVFSDPAKEAVGDLVVRPIPDDVSLSMFCQDLASWTLKWENKTKCDTAFNNKHEWIGFESARSVVLKTELVKKKQLMGLAVLNVEQDDQVACSSDTPYLLSAVHRGLTSG